MVLPAVYLQVVVHQEGNIFGAMAERGNIDLYRIDPIQQILPKLR